MNASLPLVADPAEQSSIPHYDPPLKITIPLPTEIPKARGVNATTHYGGNIRVRCTNAEYDLIQNEAAKLGLGISGFSRSVLRAVARALKEHRERGSSSISIDLAIS